MFKTLTEGFRKARQKLTGVAELTELSDRRLEHFLLATLEQGGRLSNNKRKHAEFAALLPEEIDGMVEVVRAAMTAHGMEVR